MAAAPAALRPPIVFVSCLAFAALRGLTLGVGPIEGRLGAISLRHLPSWPLNARPARRVDLGFETGFMNVVSSRSRHGKRGD